MDEVTYELDLSGAHAVTIDARKGSKEVHLRVYDSEGTIIETIRMSAGRAFALNNALESATRYSITGATWNAGDEKVEK